MIPDDLLAVVEHHGQAVARGEDRAVLADFRQDRIGQLVASARPPREMNAAQVLGVEPGPVEGQYTAHIRYTGAGGDEAIFRSRWIFVDDAWRVTNVRNVPDTPPRWPDPEPDQLEAAHWQGLERGELRLQHCPACGTWIWAPRPICPTCHRARPLWEEVEPHGTVFAWTRTWQPFDPVVTGHLPYVVVNVELAGAGGRRLMGVLLDGDRADVRIGTTVHGEFDNGLLRWRLEAA
ncbi:Zn-ribbon domain-containing OB-fold protein [Kineosporia babensis]|uniref:Zinc ribbon domain-containing protein n=1 Tax=Kineosporia babensis TaxID=499548 RepID=A0A9X1NIU6_9ACTN|nr:zinc ribbon domain-containing protein [Kineosporia babensis]MCD5314016.1 zinc ribbon domain-containing protein [Kineosporia babensis]